MARNTWFYLFLPLLSFLFLISFTYHKQFIIILRRSVIVSNSIGPQDIRTNVRNSQIDIVDDDDQDNLSNVNRKAGYTDTERNISDVGDDGIYMIKNRDGQDYRKNGTSSESVDSGISQKRMNVHYFVGISNGHQGTTYLAAKNVYKNDSSNKLGKTLFVFEDRNSVIRKPCYSFDKKCVSKVSAVSTKDYHPLRAWYAFVPQNKAEKEKQTKKLFDKLDRNWRQRKQYEQILIMGHDTIYYYEAFEKILEKTTFIRLRRPRRETARSFSECRNSMKALTMFEPVNRTNCAVNLCGELSLTLPWFSLCPLEETFNVILKVPQDTWRSFSGYQRALWYIDELEAQWVAFEERNPSANIINLRWSSTYPNEYGTLEEVHDQLANLLGLMPVIRGKKKTHGSHKNSEARDLFAVQEAEYEKKMGFSPEQQTRISKVQF